MTLNKLLLIGNAGRDPEMRYLPNGSPVTTFTVATNRIYQPPEGEAKKETEWFNIVAWGKLAEQCNQLVTRGKKVYVEGRIRTRTWDGQDGQKHSRTEVVADRVLLLDRMPSAAPLPAEGEAPASGDVEPDDIPFSQNSG